jgi:hemerythrin-like domain-containing protein
MTSEPLADARDMYAVHTLFRREFSLIPDLVRGVSAGDKSRTAVVADHVDFVVRALGVHHSDEDKFVWPILRARGTEMVASIVDLMERQHAAIHQGLLHVVDALGSWRESASARARDALADDVTEVLPTLKEHLADEEARAVPLIEQYVTAAEYGLIVPEVVAAIGQERLPLFFGMMMYESAPTVIDQIVSQMPPQIQGGIRDAAVKAYATYADKLYGTDKPPRATDQALGRGMTDSA